MTSVVGLTEILNVTVTPAPGSVQDTNVTEIAGTAVTTGAGASDAGTQRVVLSSDSAVNIAESSTPITGSLTDNGVLFTTETLGANTISIQLSGDWQALCTFQVSNDNTYWSNVQGYTFNNYMSSTNTAQDNGVYIFPVTGRYFRVVVSNYKSGTVGVVAYLRQQSLAGIGETMLTQAMDSANNTPMNVTFPGMTSTVGQQSTVNSLPVTLATENVQDKVIVGKFFSGGVPTSTVVSGDAAGSANLNGWIDCTQYRSAYITVTQSASVTTGSIICETSNDGINAINNPVGFFDTQGVASTPVSSTNTITLSGVAGTTHARFGPIGWRYLRLRVVSTIATAASTNTQAIITLRQTPAPISISAASNISYISGNALGVAALANTANQTTSVFPSGGTDNSVVNPQIQGAPTSISTAFTSYAPGPYWRRNYVDFTGGQGVAGPDPRYAEDKTYPVNVRLERTTAGQDSVQDLLQQILSELKALNYYTREMPSSIAQMLSVGNPNSEYPTAMADEPQSFYNDKNLFS